MTDKRRVNCVWALVSRGGDASTYTTGCGHSWAFEAPMEVGMSFPPLVSDTSFKFCHFCGGEIREVNRVRKRYV